MPDTEPLNRYVLSGEGDPVRAVHGMGFWTWSTAEVLALVGWMRDFNRSRRGRIEFRGFDFQNPGSAAREARAFAARALPGLLPRLDEAYAWIGGAAEGAMPAERALARLAAAEGVLAELAASPPGPPAEREWALQNARLVTWDLARKAGRGSRDRGMADNVEWLLAQAPAGARIVLWAHNAHVRKTGPAMGAHLARRLGAGYLAVGLTHGRGRYRALGEEAPEEHESGPPLAGSLEEWLGSAGLPRFVLDLRGLASGEPAALTEPRPARQAGARATRSATAAPWLPRTTISWPSSPRPARPCRCPGPPGRPSFKIPPCPRRPSSPPGRYRRLPLRFPGRRRWRRSLRSLPSRGPRPTGGRSCGWPSGSPSATCCCSTSPSRSA